MVNAVGVGAVVILMDALMFMLSPVLGLVGLPLAAGATLAAKGERNKIAFGLVFIMIPILFMGVSPMIGIVLFVFAIVLGIPMAAKS